MPNLSDAFSKLFTKKGSDKKKDIKSLPEGMRPKSKDVTLPFDKKRK